MARNVRDASLLFQVLAGPDPRDPLAIKGDPPDFEKACVPDAKGLKIAWSPDLGFAPVDPEVRNITESAALEFSSLGATVEEANLKLDGERILDIFRTVWISDYVVNYGHLLSKHRNELDPVFARLLEEAGTWSAAKLASAIHDLEWHRDQMAKLFDKYDLLLTPTLAVPAFPIGQAPEVIDGQRVIDPLWGYTPFTYAINMSGQPAASIPCGFNSEGLPVGLHIVAKQGDETTIIRASAAFEESNPWQQHRPSV
jgi:aspartyl-tRNA(Asn)/glutamyl-tRNA(Gln) amidotransferase subunit A